MKSHLMKRLLLIGTLCAALTIGAVFGGSAVGTAFAQPMTQYGLVNVKGSLLWQAQRDCIRPAGGWVKIDCSNVAAASSAELNAWSRYDIQCGDDSRVATSIAAATGLADANDGYLPAGAWLRFMTTADVQFVSCLNINADSDCRIWECL